MTTELVAAPSYVPALFNTKSVNDEFMAGLPQGGGFPRIGLSGKQFVRHIDGTPEVITGSFTDGGGNAVTVPLNQLKVVIVRGKAAIDKTYYVEKYNPNQSEAKSPDCFSRDGLRPDPTSTVKQCDTCAQCAQNQFGSGTDANGNATKGKACSDTKMLAVFCAGGVFGFKIPSASLKNFNAYLKTLAGYGLTPPAVITTIGFDPTSTYSILTFSYDGVLDEAQMAKIAQLRETQEVADICDTTPNLAAPVAPAAPASPAPSPAPSPFDTTPAPEAPAAPAPAATKKGRPSLTPVPPAAPTETPIIVGAPSEDDMREALGL
jgi:hypothetical protein